MIEVYETTSPLGSIRVASMHGELVGLGFEHGWDRVAAKLVKDFAGDITTVGRDRTGTARALESYFAGDLHALDTLEVEPRGTEFQRRVWAALRAIPHGDTISYSSLAERVGVPGAVRAAGTANGANPACLVIPCHRVIRSDGSLGGYAGGLDRKAWLLEHERRHAASAA
ncbi:MAG: methylated-DNA--[protein]-cysteine S-methyltransferase [Actinomycetota bacterium]